MTDSHEGSMGNSTEAGEPLVRRLRILLNDMIDPAVGLTGMATATGDLIEALTDEERADRTVEGIREIVGATSEEDRPRYIASLLVLALGTERAGGKGKRPPPAFGGFMQELAGTDGYLATALEEARKRASEPANGRVVPLFGRIQAE